MSSNSTESDKFSQFLEKIWDRKVWILTTTLFVAAGGFVYRVHSLRHAQFAEHKQQLLEDTSALQEAERLHEGNQLVDRVWGDLISFFDFYKDQLGPESYATPLSQSVYDEAVTKLSKFEDNLTETKAFLDGLIVSDGPRKDFLNQNREIMVRCQALAAGFRTVVEARKPGETKQELPKSERDLIENVTATASFVTSLSKSGFPRLNKDVDLITNRAKALQDTVWWENVEFYLTIPMIVFMALWIVFAIRAFVRG